ncbi:MAG: OadG family protein [Chloroflexi bacterium]|nr:OadG family protein [Chloroflexota bacterium]
MGDLNAALFIVAAGMSLVFLSLIIVMLTILALGRLFPERSPEEQPEASVGAAEVETEEPARSDSDEELVANIAVALALAQSKGAADQTPILEPPGDRVWRFYGRQRLMESRRPRR